MPVVSNSSPLIALEQIGRLELLQSLFTEEEKKAIAAHVPWTRRVRAGRTTRAGEPIDLPEFIRKNRDRLVMKPNDEYGGKGVFIGWEMTDTAWEEALGAEAQALDAPEEDGAGPQAAQLWLEGAAPAEPAGVLIGVTRADEMQRVAGEIVRLLAAGSDNVAVIFPRTGAAHLRLARLLHEKGVPFNDLLEAVQDPHVRHRRMVVEDPRGLKHLGIPIKFRDEPGRIDFDWPELGQHSAEILRGIGYRDTDIARLREDGVI